MKNLEIYKTLKERISFENVNRISELIVLRAIRTHCGYDHKFDKLYKGLLRDIFNRRTEQDTFSDAYDLVQDVNIFLLSHIGRQVDEVLYFDKKGFPVTICKACYKIVDRYAWTVIRDSSVFCQLDETIDYDTVPELFYDTEQAYDKVESLINAMNLSTDEEETLRLLYNKVSARNIADILSIRFQTVYLRRKRIQQKFLQLN